MTNLNLIGGGSISHIGALATPYEVGNQKSCTVLFYVHVQAELSIDQERTILDVILLDDLSFPSSRAGPEFFIRFFKVAAKPGYGVRAGHMLWVEQDGTDHSTSLSKIDHKVAIQIRNRR